MNGMEEKGRGKEGTEGKEGTSLLPTDSDRYSRFRKSEQTHKDSEGPNKERD